MRKHIEQIPLSCVSKLYLWPNNGHRTLAQVMDLAGTGIGINDPLYNLDWSPCGHVKADGDSLEYRPIDPSGLVALLSHMVW